MKSMVVYSSKPRKMLSFSTTKVDNVNVFCIDPATEKLTFYATKSSKSKESSETSNQEGVNGANRLLTKREKNYRLPRGKLLTDYRHGQTLSICFFRKKSVLYFFYLSRK